MSKIIKLKTNNIQNNTQNTTKELIKFSREVIDLLHYNYCTDIFSFKTLLTTAIILYRKANNESRALMEMHMEETLNLFKRKDA